MVTFNLYFEDDADDPDTAKNLEMLAKLREVIQLCDEILELTDDVE